MTELARLQRWFAHVMTHPGSVEEGVRSSEASGAGVVDPLHAARIVKPNARMSALARIGVYHYAYRARLTECLADDYPALRHALGVAAFDALCHKYIERTPSRSPVLDAYGRDLASCILAEPPEALGVDVQLCVDLARLEWAIVEVIHAPIPEPLTVPALARLAPDDFARAKLVAAPALRLLTLRHPVNAYYQAFREGRAHELPPAAISCVLVQRRGSQVFRSELDAVEARVLQDLLDGSSVGEALSAAAASGTAPDTVTGWFGAWVGRGLFTALIA